MAQKGEVSEACHLKQEGTPQIPAECSVSQETMDSYLPLLQEKHVMYMEEFAYTYPIGMLSPPTNCVL